MPVTVTCECGHVTELADREQPADAAVAGEPSHCAACGRPLATHTPTGKRVFQQLWQSHVGNASALAVPAVTAAVEEPLAAEPTKPRRSLWDVMRGSIVTPAAVFPATTEPTGEAVKPKGLWGVMHSTPSAESPDLPAALLPLGEGVRRSHEGASDERLPRANDPSMEVDRDAVTLPVEVADGPAQEPPQATATLTPEQKYAQAASLASMTHVATSWRPEPADVPFDAAERAWSRRAAMALACAVCTVLAATASYRPEWWWRAPALALGLLAVVLGLIAAGDVRQSRGRLRGEWIARSSVLLGAFGMFLAPLVFGRWGERLRETAGLDEIHSRLRRIGQGLDQFHAQQGHFPEASIRGRDAHGDSVPMHGWMTPLLPSMGHEAVYRRIDLKQPFDAPANMAAMQQPIPEFSLPHRKPARSPRGFGLTHFAGVGGQDIREPAGLVHLGLFNDQGPVKLEQFTDGLSQTIIVGEIRDSLPPWGEPGNVRSIGEGLNRQFRGFGNANGSGATFLHGDGSVKFYSSKTDRRVLQRLETRDGGEQE